MTTPPWAAWKLFMSSGLRSSSNFATPPPFSAGYAQEFAKGIARPSGLIEVSGQ